MKTAHGGEEINSILGKQNHVAVPWEVGQENHENARAVTKFREIVNLRLRDTNCIPGAFEGFLTEDDAILTEL